MTKWRNRKHGPKEGRSLEGRDALLAKGTKRFVDRYDSVMLVLETLEGLTVRRSISKVTRIADRVRFTIVSKEGPSTPFHDRYTGEIEDASKSFPRWFMNFHASAAF